MLRVFPISLTGHAYQWIKTIPTGSINTWADLKATFLNKYCPPLMTAKKVQEINNFKQRPEETLYLAWDRFTELLFKCPQHYLTDMQVVIAFYTGLDVATRMILDSQSFIPNMNAKDALIAIQERADHCLRWYDGAFKRHTGNNDSEILATITIQINNLGREIKKDE